MNAKYISIILCVFGLVFAEASAAAKSKPVVDEAAEAIPAPKENRIVRYTYSGDVIFRIFTRPSQHTHIELGEDEGLKEKPIVGDSAQWTSSGGPRNIYFKPRREGIETSVTIVTTKRVYQFQLIAGTGKDAPIYQKVSFDYPDRDAEIKLQQDVEVAKVAAEDARLANQIITPGVDAGALDFSFEIQGEAVFRPTAVYSDGKFTYLRMPPVQDLPAVLLLDEAGVPSLINYKVKENLIVVERVARALLLKLGQAEVRVVQRGQKSIWR